MKKFFFLIFIVVIIGVGGYFKHTITKYANNALVINGETLFTLPNGSNRHTLENLLIEQKIIDKNIRFQWLLRMEPQLAKFKAGTYRITPNMTIRSLLELLATGKEAQFSVRFIEGKKLSDWLMTLKEAPYLKHELKDDGMQQLLTWFDFHSLPSGEGWFYPDTYFYTAGMTDKILLQKAYNKMQVALTKVWENRDQTVPYKNSVELLIMASIIEKETGVDSERRQVASVFINRMRKGMRLQTDPTVIYGLGDNYDGRLTRANLDTYTPYNTYLIDGLPPTPIAMPSLASLQAAAKPDNTPYLYFVANGKGGHKFSTNLKDHNSAVRDYLHFLRQNKREK